MWKTGSNWIQDVVLGFQESRSESHGEKKRDEDVWLETKVVKQRPVIEARDECSLQNETFMQTVCCSQTQGKRENMVWEKEAPYRCSACCLSDSWCLHSCPSLAFSSFWFEPLGFVLVKNVSNGFMHHVLTVWNNVFSFSFSSRFLKLLGEHKYFCLDVYRIGIAWRKWKNDRKEKETTANQRWWWKYVPKKHVVRDSQASIGSGICCSIRDNKLPTQESLK